MVEGVHFTPREKPALIGRKALARALSDLAAMGAAPVAAVVTLGVAKNESVARLRGIYRGLEKLAARHGVSLVGGETTRAKELFLNVALLGECRGYAPVLRSGARPGDRIAVTGSLGATRAGKHLRFEPRLAEGQWLARHRFATALMDLSDGLGADLPRLAQASGVGFALEPEKIPRARGASLAARDQRRRGLRVALHRAARSRGNFEKEVAIRHARAFHWSIGRRGRGARVPSGIYGFDHFKQH